jgi:hypothetical protein
LKRKKTNHFIKKGERRAESCRARVEAWDRTRSRFENKMCTKDPERSMHDKTPEKITMIVPREENETAMDVLLRRRGKF